MFPSIRAFSIEMALRSRWSNYRSFSFSMSPSNEYSGLISFRIDWFDFIAVEGSLKSLLQYHNSKASILWCLAFCMVQLSHLYMTTGKTHRCWPIFLKYPVIPRPGHGPTQVLLGHKSSPNYAPEIALRRQLVVCNQMWIHWSLQPVLEDK